MTKLLAVRVPFTNSTQLTQGAEIFVQSSVYRNDTQIDGH
jgi:hypothetical protein